ncbi:hypothetical protein ANN_04624 [Periplaneta americana]|uniref:Uncharacterized protein n=1 Tax=Periplaneta americana TaxID=6978 RepID=A0ABQ8T8W8_PERAM|nr:hypothetical protein ANN_04624 [Periplaneta americana]
MAALYEGGNQPAGSLKAVNGRVIKKLFHMRRHVHRRGAAVRVRRRGGAPARCDVMLLRHAAHPIAGCARG